MESRVRENLTHGSEGGCWKQAAEDQTRADIRGHRTRKDGNGEDVCKPVGSL